MNAGDTKERPMFGCPLEEHLRLFKTDVAVVLKACCQALREQWMDTELCVCVCARACVCVSLMLTHVYIHTFLYS